MSAFARAPLPPSPPGPARLRGGRWSPRAGFAIGTALALHALVLGPLQLSSIRMPKAGTPDGVTVRLIDADPAARRAEPAAVAEATPPTASKVEPVAGRPVVAAAPGRETAATAAPPRGPAQPTVADPPVPAASAPPASRLPPAPDYLAVARLDPGPSPLGDIEPVYPERAGQQQGSVVLRLLINEKGVVDNVAVVRASPAGFFEDAALEAFGRAQFAPGRLLGVAVKSQVTIEIEFTPINRGAAVSGRTY